MDAPIRTAALQRFLSFFRCERTHPVSRIPVTDFFGPGQLKAVRGALLPSAMVRLAASELRLRMTAVAAGGLMQSS